MTQEELEKKKEKINEMGIKVLNLFHENNFGGFEILCVLGPMISSVIESISITHELCEKDLQLMIDTTCDFIRTRTAITTTNTQKH